MQWNLAVHHLEIFRWGIYLQRRPTWQTALSNCILIPSKFQTMCENKNYRSSLTSHISLKKLYTAYNLNQLMTTMGCSVITSTQLSYKISLAYKTFKSRQQKLAKLYFVPVSTSYAQLLEQLRQKVPPHFRPQKCCLHCLSEQVHLPIEVT